MKLMRFNGQWYVARHNRKLNESLLQASHDIFSTIERNIYLFFLQKSVLCDEFCSHTIPFLSFSLFVLVPKVFWSFFKNKKTPNTQPQKTKLNALFAFLSFCYQIAFGLVLEEKRQEINPYFISRGLERLQIFHICSPFPIFSYR